MLNLQSRYIIAPQLQVYDSLPTVLAPYVTYISKPNFHSKVVNTDQTGFRHSTAKTSSGIAFIDSANWWHHEHRAIMIGDSFTFGVGATSDDHTVASQLNSLSKYSFLNLGIRASNSTQQIVSAIPFLGSTESVLYVGGINNLTAQIQSDGRNSLFGPLFGEVAIDSLSAHSIFELASICEASMNNISSRRLIREIGQRLIKKLVRQKTFAGARTARSNLGANADGSLNSFAQTAVDRYERDLSIIIRAIPRGSKILFAAQPFAGTHLKQLSQEEVDLFQITDSLQHDDWFVLKQVLVKIWTHYVALLGDMCSRLGINFADLNSVDLQNWSFVDRVHMTDYGNHQIATFVANKSL